MRLDGNLRLRSSEFLRKSVQFCGRCFGEQAVLSLTRLVANALEYLPLPLQKLVFFSSIRDPYTGRYIHEGWALASSSEEVHLTLKQMHMEAFRRVVHMPLFEWCDEVHEHFAALQLDRRKAAELWLRTEPFRDMLPDGVSSLERRFFISQMRAALGVNAHSLESGFSSVQFASPRPQPAPQSQPHPDT